MSGRYGVPAAQELRLAKKGSTPGVMRRTAVLNPADRGLLRDHNLRLVLPGWSPPLLVAFRMIILVRFFAAMYTSLTGYEEAFDHWEPLHYLVRGHGFHSRSYSADHPLQSYVLLVLAAIPARIGSLSNYSNKRVCFFLVRLVLGTLSSYAEAFFYRAVTDHVSPHVGRYVLWALIFSSGFYEAATSFVPATAALFFVLLASAFALRPADVTTRRIVMLVTGFVAASFISTPLVALLAAPFVVEQLLMQGTEQKIPAGQSAATMADRAGQLGLALAASASVLLPIVLFDSRAYGQFTIVPLNVLKQTLATTSFSPNLATLSYYLYHSLLQLNVLLPLGLLSLPALAITVRVDPKRFGDLRDRLPGQTHPALSLALRLVPMHVWLVALSMQPRRDPTLLFPALPFFLLNGTTTIYFARCWVEQAYLSVTKSPYKVIFMLVQSTKTVLFGNVTRGFMFVTCLLSFARIRAEYEHFHGPLMIYAHLQNYELPRLAISRFPGAYGKKAPDPTLPRLNFSIALDECETVIPLDRLSEFHLRLCLGAEAKRFPSHFLVPDQLDVKFIEGVEGHVPQPWVPSGGSGLWGRATNISPSRTQVLEGLVEESTCHYVIDVDEPDTAKAPRFAYSEWDRVLCMPMLDVAKSSTWATKWKLPLPASWQGQTTYNEYCLLRSKKLL
ncbi:BZ3500_MvSof-1268-A1-R1_Chr8-1g09965 [Microbotryum saponariae]|uniref:Mannosyltransferase n=1 Tax=Microbotryum saponariae TaxID=289078 RepID=A0A2X0LIX1_9BASI|nr:BZ3500_MvSof-1268-A1-R1_Chr8-1g09965 [Microbotryum saponariae]SDA08251.1 BZ3501_MvSof-1269-A2-R1_Chr8-1g09688 [Microbotryum saponariae]